MLWNDEITLLKDDTEVNQNGFTDIDTTGNQKIFCSVFSVGFNEFFKASLSGYNLAKKVDVHTAEYSGERRCVLNGVEYEIIKTYEKNNGEITELTLSDIRVPEVI